MHEAPRIDVRSSTRHPKQQQPELIDIIIQSPIEKIQSDLAAKEKEHNEKQRVLFAMIDQLCAIDRLAEEAKDRLRAFRESLDMTYLLFGFGTHKIAIYFEEAGGDKGLRVFHKLHKLAFEVIHLEKSVLPNLRLGIIEKRRRAAPPPLPTHKIDQLMGTASHVRPIANPLDQARAG